MYFQRIESLSSPVILLDPPSWSKSLSRQLTKSEGVTPSLPWAFTEVTSVFVMSNRASASATCSLGFCTVCQPVKIQPIKWSQNIWSSIFKIKHLDMPKKISLIVAILGKLNTSKMLTLNYNQARTVQTRSSKEIIKRSIGSARQKQEHILQTVIFTSGMLRSRVI